jgi:hypothetical protein
MTNEINVNQDVVLAPSATRTATFVSPDQDNPYWRGLALFLNITQASGTGGLTPVIQLKDPASGNYFQLWNNGGSKTTGVGLCTWAFYPGSTDGPLSSNAILGRTWNLQIQHADNSNYTYSVGVSLIK